MAATIFNLGGVKILKDNLRFQTSDVQIITGQSADPTVTAVNAVIGSIYIRTNGEVYIKNSSGNNTDFRKITSQAALDAHINAVSGAHAASAISNTPAGNLAATNVQTALDELQSDIDTRALDSAVIKKNGTVAFTGDQSHGGFKITNLADPVSSQDAVSLSYMNARLNGLTPKAPARAATTANITLSGVQTIDTVSVVAGNRVLVKNQTLPENNGLYVAAAGAWSRATDMDAVTPFDEFKGAWTTIQEGTQAGQVYVQYGTVTTVGTDAVNFQYYNPIAGLIGGDMVTFAGSIFSVDLASAAGLESTNPGNAAGQLQVKLNGTTLDRSASGLKVADNSLTNTQINTAAAIAYSKLALTNSIVNADIAAAAAIAYSKLNLSSSIVDSDIASAAAINATKIANGTVTNAQFQFLSGVTSAIQVQLDAKANQALNNLTTTSINANLLPSSSGGRNIGSAALPWGDITSNNLNATNLNLLDTIGGSGKAILDATAARTLASGDISQFTIHSPNNSGVNFGIQAGTPTTGTTGSVFVSTGNASVNTNSGAIKLYTGTVSGSGVRGDVSLEANSIIVKTGKEVRFNNTANTFYTSLKAGTNAANLSLTLPITDGTNGQVLQTDGSGVLSFGTPSIAPGSIVNADINAAAAIAYSKLAALTANRALQSDGSGFVSVSAVTNTELGYVSGVTSAIQTQLNAKRAKGAADLVFSTNASLTSNTTNEVVTGLTFAFATYNSAKIDYRIKKGTLVRVGTLLLSTDGTTVAFNDMFVETVDSTITFDAVINGTNINIRQTNTETGTINITFEETLFPV